MGFTLALILAFCAAVSLIQRAIGISSIAPKPILSLKKLPWQPEGYNSWAWRGYKINYVDIGGADPTQKQKPPLLLIHGFGASVYHWRYNIPALSEKYHVYAIDLLGFGLSDKPIRDYSAEIWKDQVLDFIQDVIRRPCAVAGNSLGGFTALYASSASESTAEKLISSCILLNAAGRFRSLEPVAIKESPEWQKALSAAFQRFVIGISFIYTKQPARVEQVLRQVYPVNADNVDQELVKSIVHPAQDPNAAEVFYRVIKRNGAGPELYVDDLLAEMSMPLLLLWGEKDPWIRPQAADRIQSLYPRAVRVSVDAGHCPHDEAPEAVNSAIMEFCQ